MRRGFGFSGFGYGARNDVSAPPGPPPPPPPPPPSELFPDPNVEDAGDATNGWTLVGLGVSDAAPGINFAASGSGASASLVGANETAFNAAVANNSTKTVTLTFGGLDGGGTVNVSMKEGTPGAFVHSPSGPPILYAVTAGTGSGFTITGDDGDLASFTVTNISVVS